jgi:hypothetical protein
MRFDHLPYTKSIRFVDALHALAPGKVYQLFYFATSIHNGGMDMQVEHLD